MYDIGMKEECFKSSSEVQIQAWYLRVGGEEEPRRLFAEASPGGTPGVRRVSRLSTDSRSVHQHSSLHPGGSSVLTQYLVATSVSYPSSTHSQVNMEFRW